MAPSLLKSVAGKRWISKLFPERQPRRMRAASAGEGLQISRNSFI